MRFSLRGLLLVVIVLSVVLGVIADRARRQRRAVEWVHSFGGYVNYEFEFDSSAKPDGSFGFERIGKVDRDAELPGPDFLKELIGINFFHNVVRVNLMTAPVRDISSLADLPHLEIVYLSYTDIRDIAPISKLKRLYKVDLENTQIHDIRPLAGLTRMRTLRIDKTNVTDISPLERLTGIEYLRLDHTQVADLSPCAKMHNLECLYAYGTLADEAAVERLRLALPGCVIDF